MIRYFKNLYRYQYLLLDLIGRDLKVKYRRSVLGLLWSILNPLLMMLVITAVFSRIFKFGVEFFPIYYLTGSTLFNFMSESTSNAMVSIIQAAPLIKKVYIPKYIFPVEKILFAFVNLLFSLIAVVFVIIILGMQVHWTILLFPIPLLLILVFAIGLGLILSSANVFFRDISHLYSVWTTAWFYLTPVIYPINVLPDTVQKIVKLNPLYYYIDYFRQIVMYGTVPSLRFNLICITCSTGFLILGLYIFLKKQDKFILAI